MTRPEEGTVAADLLGPCGVRVLDAQCSTCIFRPGNPMHLAPGRLRDIVRVNRTRGAWLTCHATLPTLAGRGHSAACRGWVDRFGLGPVLTDLIGWFGREDVAPPKR